MKRPLVGKITRSCLWIGLFIQQSCSPSPKSESRSDASSAVIAHITTPSGHEMIALAGGSFFMGSPQGNENEQPVYEVTLSPFAIDRYEVTQERYEPLMTANPAHFKGPQHPIEQVRWSDAARYCNELSRQEGRTPMYDDVTFECNFNADGYRLPTEAEWEYACRAGAATEFDFGSDPRLLRSYSFYADNAGNTTHPTGSLKPNAWGLFDMYGNVSEWCNDRYSERYDPLASPVNPRGPREGEKRVIRGGSWTSSAESCRAAFRAYDDPGIIDACFAKDTYGFRCVRSLSESEITTLRTQSFQS